MSSLKFRSQLIIITELLLLHLLLLSSASRGHRHHHPDNEPQGRSWFEEKTGLVGSRPPSCHNKCNECHPCTPVQVSDEEEDRSGIGSNRADKTPTTPFRADKFSNYKPLGWRCLCRHHLYNP